MGIFDQTLAIDASGRPAANASGKVYAKSDETFSTPLTITDLNGFSIPDNALIASDLGVVPTFKCAGYADVIWASGDYRVPIHAMDVVPAGGDPGQVLGKVTGSDFDTGWVDPPTGGGSGLPAGGTAGQVLVKQSSTTGDATWTDRTPAGNGMLYYTGTSWPTRDDNPYPYMWVSTKHPAAPQPGSMVVGDSWLRHPDAVGL